jgi:hypothetical protein
VNDIQFGCSQGGLRSRCRTNLHRFSTHKKVPSFAQLRDQCAIAGNSIARTNAQLEFPIGTFVNCADAKKACFAQLMRN